MELNHFSSLTGITGDVLRTGTPLYSQNPRTETSFVKQYDCISPLNYLHNLSIVRMECSKKAPSGVIQVMNREPLLEPNEFKVGPPNQTILEIVAKVTANIVEVYRIYSKSQAMSATIKETLADFNYQIE